MVALGDSIIGLHAQSKVVGLMVEQFESNGADVVVAFESVPREEVVFYGIAKPRRPGEVFELDDLIEKPEVAEAPSTLAVAARYVFSPIVFDYLERTPPGKGNEIQLTDAIRAMIRDGRKALGVCLPGGERRFDIGNFESYFEAFVEFALSDPDYGASLHAFLESSLQSFKDSPAWKRRANRRGAD